MTTELSIQNAAKVRTGRKTVAFTTVEDASRGYRAMIERSGLGASRTPPCEIIDSAGRTVAYVSYNGRVWMGASRDWKGDTAPIYDPRG